MLRKSALGVAAILIASGCSSGHPSARTSPTPVRLSLAEALSRDAAATLTGRMLDTVILPSDARLTTDHDLPAFLHAPLQWPGTTNLVQAHRVWSFRGDPRTVARFVKIHQPHGYASSSTGTPTFGPHHSERVWQQEDQARVLPPNVSNADIDISIASAGGGAVLLRADAVVGWTAPRPPNEFVPTADRVVTLSVVHNYEHGRIGKRVVTGDPKLVRPIVFAFNASRVAAPPTMHTSPPGGVRNAVTYRVTFASSARARPDIVAEIDSYSEIRVSGGRAPALVDASGAFSNAVAHVLGLSEPHWG